MKRTTSSLQAIAITAFAALGLLVAHAADYIIVARNPATRQHLLNATGHGYLPRAFTGAVIGALLAAVLMAASGWTGRAASTPRVTFTAVFSRLAGVQVIGFAILEVVERIHAGLPVHHLIEASLPIGIGLQVVVAACGALVALLLERTGAALAARLVAPPAPRRDVKPALPANDRRRRLLDLLTALAPRAPPVPA